MKTILSCFIVLLTITVTDTHAQSNQSAFFGIGAGLDYGGLGIRAEFQPINKLGLFGGFGYNLANPSYNAGVSYKVSPGKKVVPVLTAMYGYNAVIRINYAFGNVDAKTYYGPSVGAGCEVYDRNGRGKWLFEIFLPFRNADFHNDYQHWKDAGVEFRPGILPVTFTVGYNFDVFSKPKKTVNP